MEPTVRNARWERAVDSAQLLVAARPGWFNPEPSASATQARAGAGWWVLVVGGAARCPVPVPVPRAPSAQRPSAAQPPSDHHRLVASDAQRQRPAPDDLGPRCTSTRHQSS
jgi:hypothetical protein